MDTDSNITPEPTGQLRRQIQLVEDDYKEKPLLDVWNALGIDVGALGDDEVVELRPSGDKIPKVCLDLVLQFREYDDKEPDSSTFRWVLSDVDTVEKNLTKAIELATSQTLVTKPPGWLFSRIAGILSTEYEIPNPRLSAREAKPNEMWPKGGIQKRSARSKVFDCARAILHNNGVASSRAWNQVEEETKLRMSGELKEALRLPILFCDDFFYEWVLLKCRRNNKKPKQPQKPAETA